MPTTGSELVDLLDLEVIEDNLFRGKQPETQLQRVFGGQVAAQALVAAERTVHEPFLVHSLHSYFLRPGDPRVPIVYDVDLVRDGRTFCTRRVMARQHGKPIYLMTASFQLPEEGFEHQDLMPDVPAPEDCPTMSETLRNLDPVRRAFWDREWSALEIRPIADSRPGIGTLDPSREPARNLVWTRVNGDLADGPSAPQLHRALFTYASDLTLLAAALIPHGFDVAAPELQSASLDHTIWFHRPFRADRWWLYDQHSPSASGGRGLALGAIYSQDGTRVATVAQEGLIRQR